MATITMRSLHRIYPQHPLILRYINQLSESWTNGKYYLAGQIKLGHDDEITGEHFDMIEHTIKTTIPGGHMMDYVALDRSTEDLNELRRLVHLIR